MKYLAAVSILQHDLRSVVELVFPTANGELPVVRTFLHGVFQRKKLPEGIRMEQSNWMSVFGELFGGKTTVEAVIKREHTTVSWERTNEIPLWIRVSVFSAN